jgi:hypothetical protein
MDISPCFVSVDKQLVYVPLSSARGQMEARVIRGYFYPGCDKTR